MNSFYKHCIALMGIAITLLCSNVIRAQTGRSIDSIRAKVQRLSSDSEKVGRLLDAVSGLDCDDSLNKLTLANDAKHLAESIKWQKGIFSSNRVLGQVYLQCEKNRGKAFEFFQINVALAQKNGDKKAQAEALSNIAKNYTELHDLQRAIEYYNSVIKLDPSVENKAIILGNIGVAFNDLGDYDRALVYLDSSLKMFLAKKTRDRQDTNEIAGIYLNMGDLYLAHNEPDKAYEQYQKVLKSGASGNDRKMETWGLMGIGKSYRMKKDYKRAIENYLLALKVCRENNQFEEEVKSQDELATTYLETWQLSQAQAYADSALSLAEIQHYLGLLSQANATMGEVFLKQNKYELAISYLSKALGISKQTNNLTDRMNANHWLSEAYKLNKQGMEALTAYEEYITARDSIQNIEKLNEFTKNDLNIKYRDEKMTDSLKTHFEFTETLKRQRVFTYVGFFGLMLVLALAFFMYRSYVTQKKYNELLATEKKRHLAHIEAQSNILSDIADTQAHQIRGPISTILGLVHIFNYEDPTDPMNKQVMEWVTSTTEKLDAAVKDVIIRENKLRSEHDESETSKDASH